MDIEAEKKEKRQIKMGKENERKYAENVRDNLLLWHGAKQPFPLIEVSDDEHDENRASTTSPTPRKVQRRESTMKVTNTNAENIVEAVQSIGNQVATAARESGGTSIVPELFKLLEHIEQRMMELNTRLSKLEVLVELLMKKYSEEKTVLFWC